MLLNYDIYYDQNINFYCCYLDTLSGNMGGNQVTKAFLFVDSNL